MLRGIHETQGIVTSNWTGEMEEVGWAEIDHVNIIPYVGKRAANEYGSESSFAWHLEIIQSNGKNKVYKHWFFSNQSMKEALKVKNKIRNENISLTIGRMNEVTKEWYEVEIEVEKVNRKLSDEFFLQ